MGTFHVPKFSVSDSGGPGGKGTAVNIRGIKPYKYDTKFGDSSSKMCMMMPTYELPVIYSRLKPKLGTKYMIGCAQGH